MTAVLREELEAVTALAMRAGGLLLEHFGQVRRVERKGAVELVTEVDRRSEELLLRALRELFPADSLEGEEGGGHRGTSGRRWYVDPLDGTTNFVHGYSHFAVSLGCCDAQGPLLGAVCAPYLDECYLAARGLGAWQRRPRAGTERRLPAREPVAFTDALLATGFSYVRDERIDRICELVRRCLRGGCHGVRRAGSAAVDLAHVGAGRLDGYFELSLRPWDVAAGILVCRETGCAVTDWRGRHEALPCAAIAAAAPGLDRVLRDLLEE
jgi:myo-inositol-1(or 4)-monophosphatase